jgi:hypothetical protein
MRKHQQHFKFSWQRCELRANKYESVRCCVLMIFLSALIECRPLLSEHEQIAINVYYRMHCVISDVFVVFPKYTFSILDP